MEEKKLQLQQQIFSEIVDLYNFHGYDCEKSRIIELVKLVIDIMPTITADKFKEFVHMVKTGEYGMLYKAPTSLITMFRQFKGEPLPSYYKPLRTVPGR